MNIVKLGEKVQDSTIHRYTLPDGYKGRVSLITDSVLVIESFYDSTLKRRVHCTAEQGLKNGITPFKQCFIPVAVFTTTPDGSIVSNVFTIQYLQLSINSYQELSQSIQEVGKSLTTILVSKQTKKVEDKDYSTLIFKPSTQPLSEEVLNSLKEVRNNDKLISTTFELINNNVAIPFEVWAKQNQNSIEIAPEVNQLSPVESSQTEIKQLDSNPIRIDSETKVESNSNGSESSLLDLLEGL